MLFNNDLLFVAGSVIFIAGGAIITYSFYKFPIVNKSESLGAGGHNTTSTNLSTLDSTGNIQLHNLPSPSYTDAAVQAVNTNVGAAEASIQTANHYVNTGMQTSARMWLESIKNWINEILSNPQTNQASHGYVDAAVQTNTRSTFQIVKDWFREVASVRSSELTDLGEKKVAKWMDKLESVQSVDLHDSDFSLTTRSDISNNTLQQLVAPNDSVSNISEVISESNLQNAESVTNRVYDITDPTVLANYMEDPSVYSYFDITDNIYYIMADTVLTADPSIVNLICSIN